VEKVRLVSASTPHSPCLQRDDGGQRFVCGLDVEHSDFYTVNQKVGTVMQDTDANSVASV
jgi:hypothetical protein